MTLAGARRMARRHRRRARRALLVLPESWHLVGVDVERERCADAVVLGSSALGLRGSQGPAGRRA